MAEELDLAGASVDPDMREMGRHRRGAFRLRRASVPLDRLDRVFTNSGSWSDLDPCLTELPSSQVPGRVFGCFFDDMVGIDARHQIGIEQLVFETNYPHQDSTWPDTPDLVAEIGKRVSAEELEMLVRSNAIRMLDLEPGDLRPEHLRTDGGS